EDLGPTTTGPARQVHVEQHDLRFERGDLRDRGIDIGRLADDVDGVAEVRAKPRAEDRVVVDDEHAGHATPPAIDASRCRCTSVPTPPAPGATVAVPPARVIRPMIDSRMPSRSSGRPARSTPDPRSRMNTSVASGEVSR